MAIVYNKRRLMSMPSLAGDDMGGMFAQPKQASRVEQITAMPKGFIPPAGPGAVPSISSPQSGRDLLQSSPVGIRSSGMMSQPTRPTQTAPVSYSDGSSFKLPEATAISANRQQDAPQPAAPQIPENPYGPDYIRSLEGEVIQTTGQEFERARQQILGNLASRGISADSPLAMSLIAQAQGQEAEGRRRGLMEARTQANERAAEFNMRRALLPSQIAIGEAQARQQNIQAQMAQLEFDLKNYSPEQRRELADAAVQRAKNELQISDVEARAAKEAFERGDVQNLPWWMKGLLIGASAGVGYYFGGAEGALFGGQLGVMGVGAMSGPEAQAAGQIIRPRLPASTTATPATTTVAAAPVTTPLYQNVTGGMSSVPQNAMFPSPRQPRIPVADTRAPRVPRLP